MMWLVGGGIPKSVAQDLYADLQQAQHLWMTPYLSVQIHHHIQEVGGAYQRTEQMELHLTPEQFGYLCTDQQVEVQGNAHRQLLIDHQQKSIYISTISTETTDNFRQRYQPDSLFQQFETVRLVEQTAHQRIYTVTLKANPAHQITYHIQQHTQTPAQTAWVQLVKVEQVFPQGKMKTTTQFTYQTHTQASYVLDALTDVVEVEGQWTGQKKYTSYEITSSSYGQ